MRWTLHRSDEQRTITVRGHISTNAPLALLTLALEGLGIALLPDWLVKDDIAAGHLQRLLPDWSSAPIAAWAIHRAELRGNPRVTAFLDALAVSET